ncbi:MAG: TRAP transporter substrate-binding protein DctP [Clostridiales Family XIII bacterium]|nr:TRAP transporter substrate-binding protein DctP [Clostridiales Family XIII bacterium]
MKKKNLLLLLLVAVMVAAMAGCGGGSGTSNDTAGPVADSAADADADGASDEVDRSDWVKMDLNWASYLPEGDGDKLRFEFIDAAMEKHLPGYITFNKYFSGTLLTQDVMLDGIRAGTTDIGFVDFAASGDFPVSKIWYYASVNVASQTGGTAALTDWAQQTQPDEYKDFVFLWGNCLGPASFMTTFPIESVADIQGKQLNATGAMQETLKSWGANPINMTTGEVYEAVRSGMIAGAYASFGSQARLGLTEVAPYATMVPMGSAVYGFLMNKDSFNRMPESQREAFMAAWDEAFYDGMMLQWEKINQLVEPSIMAAAATVDWTFIDPDTAEYKEFASKSQGLLDEYLDSLDARGIDGRAEYANIQKYLDKWCANWWTFERHSELYKACADGTIEEYKANWSNPQPIPTR